MKKLLTILVATSISLGVMSLSACGSDSSSTSARTQRQTTRAVTTAYVPPTPLVTTAGDVSLQDEEPQAETLVLQLAESHSIGYPTVIGLEHFAQKLEELTDGEIVVEIHAGGTLGTESETIEQVRDGELAMVRVGTNVLADINPEVNALGLPYLYRDREHMFTVLDGPIGTEIRESMRNGDMLGLCWFDAGARSFYFVDNEVSTPADMSGMKVRVQPSELMQRLVELLGGEPEILAFPEVLSGLQGGIVDAAENSVLSYESTLHYEVAPYLTLNEHTRSPEMILINADLFDSLSDEHQQAMLDAAADGARVQREEWLKQEAAAEAKVIEGGATITKLTPAQRQLFVDAVAPLYDDYADLADIVERIQNS
ncbi:MAG: TRAP transporter substrate-binding protein [Oscillospiraceae bacterium]|nr:TRAP transporter substrate-binding protein [Oscillospiraceae bacterium]